MNPTGRLGRLMVRMAASQRDISAAERTARDASFEARERALRLERRGAVLGGVGKALGAATSLVGAGLSLSAAGRGLRGASGEGRASGSGAAGGTADPSGPGGVPSAAAASAHEGVDAARLAAWSGSMEAGGKTIDAVFSMSTSLLTQRAGDTALTGDRSKNVADRRQEDVEATRALIARTRAAIQEIARTRDATSRAAIGG